MATRRRSSTTPRTGKRDAEAKALTEAKDKLKEATDAVDQLKDKAAVKAAAARRWKPS